MELNGCANIDMAIQSRKLGYITEEQFIKQVNDQNELLMEYLKEISNMLPKDYEVIKWHDLKEKLKKTKVF